MEPVQSGSLLNLHVYYLQTIRLGNHRQKYFRCLAMVRYALHVYGNTILSYSYRIQIGGNEFWNRLIFVFRTCAMSCVYPLPYLVSWMKGTARN